MFNPVIHFDHDPASYVSPSWDELDQLSFELAKQVLAQQTQPDLVLALAKGAWPLSRPFVDYLEMTELASLGVRFYSGINHRLKKPSVYQEIPCEVLGKRVLIFDDVADTGESLQFSKEYLMKKGAKSVETATLFLKSRSILIPEYFAAETDAWIIFPFERQEMMRLLGETWTEQGISKQEQLSRFQKLNFPENIIHFFNERMKRDDRVIDGGAKTQK